METDYQELIAAVSREVAKIFLANEDNLAVRATLLDADISEITRQIGVETTKKVLFFYPDHHYMIVLRSVLPIDGEHLDNSLLELASYKARKYHHSQ